MSRLHRKVAAGLRCLSQRLPRSVELFQEEAQLVRHFQGVPDLQRLHGRADGRRLSFGVTVEASPQFLRKDYGHYAAAAVEPGEDGLGAGWDAGALLQEESVFLGDEHGLSDEDGQDSQTENREIDGSLGEYPQTARVQERVQFLRELGLSEEHLTALQLRSKTSVRSALLQISLKKLTDIARFFTEDVGLSKEQAASCLFHDFYLGSSSVDGSLRPKVQYFRQLGFSQEEIVKLVRRRSSMQMCHMVRTIVPMTRKLNEMGLQDEDIIKVYLRSPKFLRTRIGKIDNVVEYMRKYGVTDSRKTLKRPKLFDLSLDGKVLEITNLFKEHLKLDSEQLHRVLKWTQVFSSSVEKNLRVMTDYFESLGLPKEDVARMVSVFPNMMGLNIETSIKPKVDYLLVGLNRNISDLVQFPVYLSYSLTKRIQPRSEYMKANGCYIPSLSYYLSCSEDEFFRRVKNRLKTKGDSDSKCPRVPQVPPFF